MKQDHTKDETASEPIDISTLPDFAKNILKHAEKISQEALDEFPPDYSENLDHYLYGMPKKSPRASDAPPSVQGDSPMTTTTDKDGLAKDGDKKPTKPQDVSGPPAFVKRLIKMSENMSQEDRDKFPPDYSENLDHYLYGMPKKTH